jgi:negative regulator of flagellin synthesis FlgM
MDVNGPSPVRPSVPIHTVQPTGDVSGTGAPDAVVPQDQLQISDAARMMEKLDQASELHQARLDQIKDEIRNGTYETPEKLEEALWKLLREIESEPK